MLLVTFSAHNPSSLFPYLRSAQSPIPFVLASGPLILEQAAPYTPNNQPHCLFFVLPLKLTYFPSLSQTRSSPSACPNSALPPPLPIINTIIIPLANFSTHSSHSLIIINHSLSLASLFISRIILNLHAHPSH